MTDPTRPEPGHAPDDLASAEGAALSEAIEEVDQPEPLPTETHPGLAGSLARGESEAEGSEEADDEAEVEADEADADDQEPAPAQAAAKPGRRLGRTPRTKDHPTPATAAVEPDVLPYIDDPASKWWVILIAVVFAAIFAWGIFLGHGGMFTPIPTPSPIPTATAAPSATATPSPTPIPSSSPSAGGSPSPTSS